jgi:hypothetical protein
MTSSERARAIAAQGWTMMFFAFLANIVMDSVRTTVEGTTQQWAAHFGRGGVPFILVVMAVYVVMPMLIQTLSAPWFRFTAVGFTVLMTLFVGAHEVSHLVSQDKPFGLLHALDFSHHLLGAWTTAAVVVWARDKQARGASAGARKDAEGEGEALATGRQEPGGAT